MSTIFACASAAGKAGVVVVRILFVGALNFLDINDRVANISVVSHFSLARQRLGVLALESNSKLTILILTGNFQPFNCQCSRLGNMQPYFDVLCRLL